MKRLIYFLVLITSLSFSSSLQAQDEQAAVKKVIETMFDSMRAGDSATLHTVFTDDVIMQSIIPKRGVMSVHEGSLEGFLRGVGSPHDKVYDERILSYDIKIDGPMATVWTPYKFYLGEEFSHCGVNSFQLMKTADGWKIIYLVDTRRMEACPD